MALQKDIWRDTNLVERTLEPSSESQMQSRN